MKNLYPKILTIIGARPQIIKAAALNRIFKSQYHDKIQEILVHTGQHYDEQMSGVFFDELGIPNPDYNLEVGSLSHSQQTAKMIQGIEQCILLERPNAILVYGDTNSTLAGALVASKMDIPLIHIEAGLRSFNKKMPEEINRITCDHNSTLLFSPTKTAVQNLIDEGFNIDNKTPYSINKPMIYHCGDIMFDNSLYFGKLSDKNSKILDDLDLTSNHFILATVHRAENTDDKNNLKEIFEGLIQISKEIKVVLPLHPRTRNKINLHFDSDFIQLIYENLEIIEPVSFLDMIALEKNCKSVITDSGGVQKEAYFFQKPTIICRNETEWTEIINAKTAKLSGAQSNQIIEYYHQLSNQELNYPPIFGNGNAASEIAEIIWNKLLINFQ